MHNLQMRSKIETNKMAVELAEGLTAGKKHYYGINVSSSPYAFLRYVGADAKIVEARCAFHQSDASLLQFNYVQNDSFADNYTVLIRETRDTETMDELVVARNEGAQADIILASTDLTSIYGHFFCAFHFKDDIEACGAILHVVDGSQLGENGSGRAISRIMKTQVHTEIELLNNISMQLYHTKASPNIPMSTYNGSGQGMPDTYRTGD